MNAKKPVVLEGAAEILADLEVIRTFLDASNAKYETSYGLDFLDPAANATIRVRPQRVFGLTEADFTGSPTRWIFE